MTSSRLIRLFVTVMLFSLALSGIAQADTPPAIGMVAPDFTLTDQAGDPINLHDYRGHWIVLYFYPKDFTSGCTLEAHGFQTDLAQYQKRDVVILGVSVDSADSHKDFCAKEGLNFKLLSDAKHTVSASYGSLRSLGPFAIAARNTFIVDPSGKIVKTFIGVQPATHSREVLAALDTLQKKP